MMAMMTTAIRPTIRTSFALASLRTMGWYRSEVKELDATSSWESAVETEAAMMAASRKPEMTGGKKRRAMTMKTVFWAPTVSSSSPTIILAW